MVEPRGDDAPIYNPRETDVFLTSLQPMCSTTVSQLQTYFRGQHEEMI
jgi:hypothetical protein